jgi:hypothetical protein
MEMETYRSTAGIEWEKARRKAFWSKLLHVLSPTEDRLLSFDEVASRLKLRNSIYRGRQIVPLDKIVGSVGRYHDFTKAFLPTGNIQEDRWKAVAALYLNPTGRGVPPVELYKAGNVYFVKDGNHRVSVARQLELPEIEAYVWEFTLPIPDADLADGDIDKIILEAERQDFLRETNLNTWRPHHNINLTLPGGYTDLLHQISHYQSVLSKIDQTEITYAEAVTAWYDMIYETTILKIRTEKVLDMFPGRTEADFFVWITRYHRELKAQYDRPIMLSQVVRNFREKHRPNLWRNMKRLANKIMGREVKESP